MSEHGAAPLQVRAARPADLDVLVAFNLAMARETEELHLDPERLREGVRKALSDPSRGAYRLAQRGGEAVGALLLTREWSDWRDAWFWWIQSVYVAPSARRQGVYSALHASVLDDARVAADVCGVRLYVEVANEAAQATYVRLGMRATRYALFEAPVPRAP